LRERWARSLEKVPELARERTRGRVADQTSLNNCKEQGLDHDRDLAEAFDACAEQFEGSPVQSDPAALARLVELAAIPAGSVVLDTGCGPGLTSEAFLKAGYNVVGVDLSAEMVARARNRCARFGDRARFAQGSIFDPLPHSSFDAAFSRYVLHHVVDPLAFVSRQVALVKPGGVVAAVDHITDPDPARAAYHQRIELERDRTHTMNYTAGGLIDVFAAAGLIEIRLVEERFQLDFDEWFDRGTPAASKEKVRTRVLEAPPIRGFHASLLADGSIRIDCVRAHVRALKAGP
jgi:SAM-dependent methyltransferase